MGDVPSVHELLVHPDDQTHAAVAQNAANGR